MVRLGFNSKLRIEERDRLYNELVSIVDRYKFMDLEDKVFIVGIVKRKLIENNNGGK